MEPLAQHRPYHESDHVLNIAYNALCGGNRLEDIEARRCDRVFLDGLGAEALLDPTNGWGLPPVPSGARTHAITVVCTSSAAHRSTITSTTTTSCSASKWRAARGDRSCRESDTSTGPSRSPSATGPAAAPRPNDHPGLGNGRAPDGRAVRRARKLIRAPLAPPTRPSNAQPGEGGRIMPTGPAVCVGDPVAHPVPPVLTGGTGSLNVLIGGKPAWRGIPAAAAAAIQNAKMAADTTIATAQAATAAAAGTPGYPAAKAAEESIKNSSAVAMSATIRSTAAAAGATGGVVDVHNCVTPPVPPPPHGPGVVIDGSKTVLINGLPACRLGDTVMEAFGPPNKIALGQPRVIIGG